MFTDKVCRACLSESNEMKALTAKIVGENRTLLDALHFVTNINLITRNGVPKQVCSECESILCKADAFKRRCLESESILTQHLDGESTGEFLVDLPKSSIIKDEIASEMTASDLFHPSQSTINARKSTEPTFDILFDNLTEQDDKIKIFADVSVTKHNKRCSDESKDVLAKGNSRQVVKEEENTEFEAQDEMFDFGQASFDNDSMEYDEKPSKDEAKVFNCKCGTNFDTKDEYKSHWRTSNCNGYKKSVKIKKESKTTKKSQIEIKKQIVCTECNLEFHSIKSFKLHQRKHKEKDEETGNFECTLCMRKFVRKCSYTNHMKQHNLKSNIKYTCETCKRDFQHKAHLDNHVLALHSRDKGFQCEICSTHFATQESLDIHKDSHNVDKKHQCSICKKSFYMLSTLNDHLRVHTGEKPFLCSICGRGFSQKTNLAQHMRRHQGLKPFKCEDCNKRFVSKGELVAHNRKHSGAHPFVCDDCGSGFTTSSSLVKHRRMHTGERPYACDLCSMRFAASGTLKNHRRTHTGEKPFQCSYCEKAFVQRHDLIAHIRGHTGERPYTCGCGQAFRKASALKAHVRLHGKEPQRELSLLHTTAILHGTNNLNLNNDHSTV